MHLRPAATRLALTLCLFMLAVLAPPFISAGIQTTDMSAAADGWVNGARPGKNHGLESRLRTYGTVWESYVRFDVSAWRGRRFASLQLRLTDVRGDASTLVAAVTDVTWDERTLNYGNRPERTTTRVRASVNAQGVAFELAGLFPNGKVNMDALSIRVTNSVDAAVTFGAREATSAAPRLSISGRINIAPSEMTPYQDVHASEETPAANYATTPSMVVDADPATEAFMSFDVSGWSGQSVGRIQLRLWLKDDAGVGVSIYRIGAGWNAASVSWEDRPVGGTLVRTTTERTPAGLASFDISEAFPSGAIDRQVLSLRVATTSSNGFVLSSSEGSVPPQLLITPGGSGETPSPTPTSSPSGQRYAFHGFGTDHGVGLSQYGARGRAAAGQTYDQILAHYYTGTTLGRIDRNQLVRVVLAYGHEPTRSSPARITAREGSWSSQVFMASGSPRVFPADSYAEMTRAGGGWVVSVYGSSGALLASAAAADMTMAAASGGTLFEMRWRSSLDKYDLYRGKMRLLGDEDGAEAVNAVAMDDYLKGVVPAEMPPLWPFEAVKAQAVAARGYAYVRLKPGNVYDVQPTADNQVYGGVRLEHPRSNQAVDDTSGQVVMAGGVPANTYLLHRRWWLHREQRIRLGERRGQGRVKPHLVPARRARRRSARPGVRPQCRPVRVVERLVHVEPVRGDARRGLAHGCWHVSLTCATTAASRAASTG